MRYFKLCSLLVILFALALGAQAQTKQSYSYEAQEAFIPSDLGKFYLGMPFKEFASQFDISKADADTRFDFISLDVPYEKGAITGFSVRITGVPTEKKTAMSLKEVVKKKDEDGYEYEDEYERIAPSKVGDEGFVYAIYISFRKDFDLRSYVIKTYGKDGEVRKPDEEYYFYDIQWTKETPDGLTWLIRSFHEGDGHSLQLLGRIPGTEWSLD